MTGLLFFFLFIPPPIPLRTVRNKHELGEQAEATSLLFSSGTDNNDSHVTGDTHARTRRADRPIVATNSSVFVYFILP